MPRPFPEGLLAWPSALSGLCIDAQGRNGTTARTGCREAMAAAQFDIRASWSGAAGAGSALSLQRQRNIGPGHAAQTRVQASEALHPRTSVLGNRRRSETGAIGNRRPALCPPAGVVNQDQWGWDQPGRCLVHMITACHIGRCASRRRHSASCGLRARGGLATKPMSTRRSPPAFRDSPLPRPRLSRSLRVRVRPLCATPARKTPAPK